MKQFDYEEREKILAAGEMCLEDLLLEIENCPEEIEDTEAFAEAKERLGKAEEKAWARLSQQRKRERQRRWGLVAACFVLMLAAVLLIGKPSVAYQKLWNHIFVKDNTETSISIVSSSTVLLPEDWSGCYLLTELPEGFKIESTEKTDFGYSIFYINDDNGYIDFSVSIDDYNVHLDIEDCTVEEIMIGDNKATLITKADGEQVIYRTLYWIDDNTFFYLSCNDLTVEVLQGLVKSVMLAE